MTARGGSAVDLPARIAAVVSVALSPPWVGVASLAAISHGATTNWKAFFLWWVLSAGAVSVAPLALVLLGVRKGWFSDRDMTRREERRWPFVFGLTTTGGAIAGMVLLNAPHEILAVSLAAMAGGGILFFLTPRWKPSMHTAAVTGAGVVLAIHYGPPMLPLLALVPIVGWARIRVRAHSLQHVVAGGLVGVMTGVTFRLLRLIL